MDDMIDNQTNASVKDTFFDISVIIPIYDVEEYLEECLNSVLKQGDIRLQVIMIDDGSTDNSGNIADRYAEKYDNFFCYHIENGGLGHARNVGVKYATGKYIIFLDSDDIVVSGIYEKMFNAAEHDSSEMVICNVERFNSKRSWDSELHKRVFRNFERVSHISSNHNLISDTTSWNKLILREFYLKNNFQFPENILYEDIPVTIPMHILCNSVSVLSEIGYRWRVRDGASKSITQMVSSMDNLKDRIAIIRMLDVFFNEKVSDRDLHFIKQKKALETDLKIFVNMCASIPEDNAYEILDLINEYIDEAIDEDVFSKLTIIDQQKYAYVRSGDLNKLIELLKYQPHYYLAPIKEVDGKLLADLPEELFTVKERDMSREFSEYIPRNYIDKVKIGEDHFDLTAHIYIRRINVANEEDLKVKAFLYHEESNTKVPLSVTKEPALALTDTWGRVITPESNIVTNYNYNGSGFIVRVGIKDLEIANVEEGNYKLLLEYEHRYYSGNILLGGINAGNKGGYKYTSVINDNYRMELRFGNGNQVIFSVTKEPVLLKGMEAVCDGVLIKTNIKDNTSLYLTTRYESIEPIKLEASNNEGGFLVDPQKLIEDVSYHVTDADNFYDANRKLIDENKSGEIIFSDAGTVIFMAYRSGVVKIKTKDSVSRITSSHKEKKKLYISVETSGKTDEMHEADKAQLVFYDRITGRHVVLAESLCVHNERHINNDFIIDFSDHELIKDFYAKTKNIIIIFKNHARYLTENPLHTTIDFSHIFRRPDLQIFCYRSMYAEAKIKTEQKWPWEESSQMNRNILISNVYPKFRKKKIKENRILFESMWGQKYSCNPQAIYEYIDKNYPGYECIWALNDARMPISGNGIRVRRGSLKYYYYLATAKYLFNNVNFKDDYVKRDGQIEVQTMHGTPLKTLGLDVKDEIVTKAQRDAFIAKTSRWDHLIVQGRFMEDKAASIYEFHKNILKTGYPRTDELSKVTDEEKRALKDKLGLPQDKKIILYAPTWRVRDRFDMQLDLERMKEKLSDEYCIMIRVHYFSSKGYSIPVDGEFIFNLNQYGKVEDLYTITDILITDYSSTMFDFALTGKPMIFFTYDMEEYTERLRGIYVDFEKEAPGPICMTSDEVINAVLNIDEEVERARDRISLFNDKYLTYEQADSTKAVVDQVIKPQKYKAKWMLNKKLDQIIPDNTFRLFTIINSIRQGREINWGKIQYWLKARRS